MMSIQDNRKLLIMAILFGTCWALSCNKNEDCKFGATCNLVNHQCTCTFSCADYAGAGLVCWNNKRKPRRLCEAISLACESQINAAVKPFNAREYLENGNKCSTRTANRDEEFCEDQSVCRGNGICFKKLDLNVTYCHCKNHYTGSRCESKILKVSDGEEINVSKLGVKALIRMYIARLKNFDILSMEQPGDNQTDRIPGPVVGALVAVAILSFLVVTCAIVAFTSYLKRRRPDLDVEVTDVHSAASQSQADCNKSSHFHSTCKSVAEVAASSPNVSINKSTSLNLDNRSESVETHM